MHRIIYWHLTAALVAMAVAAPAVAADWSGEVGVASDYRYRGVSLSDGKPALQASITAEHASGAYASLWSSTLTGRNTEFDATAGYGFDLAPGISLDLSATYYAYPRGWDANAFETTAELQASKGPVTLSIGSSIAPPQGGTRDEAGRKSTNLYGYGSISLAVREQLSVRAQLGHEDGPWDMRAGGGKWDWSAGLDLELHRARLSIDYVGSNASSDALVAAAFLKF